MAQYRYSASGDSHSTCKVTDHPSLLAGHEIWAREVHNVKRPRSFLHVWTPESLERLEAAWRPTEKFPTFTGMWDSLTPDVVAQGSDPKPKTVTPRGDVIRARHRAIIELLNDDLFLLCAAAAAAYPAPSPLLQPAMRRVDALFASVSEAVLDSRERLLADPEAPLTDLSYVPLVSPFDDKPMRSSDKADAENASLPSLVEQQQKTTLSIREKLLAEAEELLPHLSLALMQSTDRGTRLKQLSEISTELYGTAAQRRRRSLDGAVILTPGLLAPIFLA
ncbi:hypothetical protein J8273_1800 [Carpediemonas membranifera]|uniref:Uncharacterized protein n=1 Tax=Carpediemonas membranifera TaxID=201153 RepID=A0A8J6BBE9_9EUKA|nr:hypothetical protein J8273_1800 [Carpediemonas membranifera]|eukprot:KAG9396767.1 hypothetical protein J8273_1800 [Carpediemonas membranifera]